MKTSRFGFVALAVAVVTLTGRAQTVQYMLVSWSHNMTQDSASHVGDSPTDAYQFSTSIQGTNGDPVTLGTFSPNPTLGLTTGSTGPSLTFNSDASEYDYKSSSYGSQASLLGAFPTSGSSAYALNLDNAAHTTINGISLPTTVTLPTVPDLSTAAVNTPLMSLTNGSWLPNGTFLVTDVAQPITITFLNSVSSTPGSNPFHYNANLNGATNVSFVEPMGFLNADPTGQSSPTPGDLSIGDATISANTLIDGNTYQLNVSYAQILAYDSTVLGNTAFAAALMENNTTITIVTQLAAVPEPATCALLVGLAALAGVMARRGKKRALAA